MTLRELLTEKNRIQAGLDVLAGQVEAKRAEMATVDSAIDAIISDYVRQARALSGKDTGTVMVVVDGISVKHCLSKRVVWDQAKMQDIWNRILDAGDEPENYLDVRTSYTVKEKLFESFPPSVKDVFMQAREIRTGAPKITFLMEA